MIKHLRAVSMSALFLVAVSDAAMATEPPSVAVIQAINKVLVPRRPNLDGILTVRDNTLYVQCINRPNTTDWRCEAAGLEGEPWLRNVLTTERQEQLIALGFKPNVQFGNFVRSFPRSMATDVLARTILSVLTKIYDAEPDGIEALVDWLPARRCHPRLMAGHDRGGSIATPHWGFAKDTATGCRIATNTEDLNYNDPGAVPPGAPPDGPVDLDGRYGPGIAAQIKRLEGGRRGDHIWAIFDAGIPYIQCAPDMEENSIYCEAASEDASGAPLARILTPERRQKLIAAGFEPPGKVVNFRRFYSLDSYDEAAVAHAVLAVLHDCYGYGGAPALMLHTEAGKASPL